MEQKWWHGKTAYQIYPKSFCDSNGDGIGDLPGIISKLDYLKALGIDILWLSPIYPSPFVDQGYDISDYENIDPSFGTLEDFDRLMKEAKARGIDVIMDLVVNHCSSEHKWFKKACADLNSEEAGYFYFIKGKDGKVPNNLRSYFGGSVWEKIPGHENEDIYYSHYFAKEQPDLNWYNPKLREQVYKLVTFWLDKGVAGFRVDAILSIVKDLSFPDLPPDDSDGMTHAAKMNARNLSQIGKFLNELKDRTFTPHDSFTVGEVLTVTKESVTEFAGPQGYFSTLFDLSPRELIEAHPHYREYPNLTVDEFVGCVFNTQELYQKADAFVAPIIENHDEPRGVSYYLPRHAQTPEGAKAFAAVLLLLRGMPFIYQGQEIGMTNTQFNSIYEFDDVNAKDNYKTALEAGLTERQALDILNLESRDNARTPMLWSDEKNAGFSSAAITWLKVHQDYKTLNVASQRHDPKSVFSFYKTLIALKKQPEYKELLTYGRFKGLTPNADYVVPYMRELNGKHLYVIANFEDSAVSYDLPSASKIVVASNDAIKLEGTKVTLPAVSAVVVAD